MPKRLPVNQWTTPDSTQIILLRKTNPKSPFSPTAARYELYRTVKTVGEYRQLMRDAKTPAFANLDLGRDRDRGHIRLKEPVNYDWLLVAEDEDGDHIVSRHITIDGAYAARTRRGGGKVVELMELNAQILKQERDEQDAWETYADDQPCPWEPHMSCKQWREFEEASDNAWAQRLGYASAY